MLCLLCLVEWCGVRCVGWSLPVGDGGCHGEFGVVLGRSSVNCCSSVIVWMWSLNTRGVLVKWG